jgi:hypothetical protein
MALRKSKFSEDDPLRYLHVSRRKRHDTDEGEGSNAITDETGADDDDLDRYKPGGDFYSDQIIEDLS